MLYATNKVNKHTVTSWLKAGIVEQVESVIARQQHGKHISTATETDATTEDVVFSMLPLLGNGTVNTCP
jgi:hypothetical protein